MTRRRVPWLCAAIAVAVFVLDLRLQPGGAFVTRAIDDLSQLVAAAAAGGACLWRARATAGRLRGSWALIGAGASCWALGEVVWSWYELVEQVETPFPSFADVGYLLFPMCTAVGLVVRPSRAFTGRSWTRIALDVLLVVLSLGGISWATAFGQVFHGVDGVSLSAVVGLAYPAGDIALLTVVVIVLSYARTGRRLVICWLGVGLAAFAVADSGFAYLTAVGSYQTGNVIDACWVAGFLIIAAASTAEPSGPRAADKQAARYDEELAPTPQAALLLPYVPAGACVIAAELRMRSDPHDVVILTTAALAVWLLIARQIIVLFDNRRLVSRVSHQATHDSLTGLGNRALFGDRLGHALDRHRNDRTPVTLTLVDLDDFKTVNDSIGHAAGDELLMRVSDRLRASVRPGDTLVRLGGDEFAVLLGGEVKRRDSEGHALTGITSDVADGDAATARIMAGLAQPVRVGQREIAVSASIGVVTLSAGDAPTDASDMLRRADIAMYTAKRAGKSRASRYAASSGDPSAELDVRTELAADIAAARIDVAGQVMQLADGSLYGVEAFARWRFQGHEVEPAQFLPVAAAVGALADLDAVVIDKAVAATGSWADRPTLSVNVSGPTLADDTFSRRLERVLLRHGFDAGRLVVELLEPGLAEHDRAAASTLSELRAMGVRIAVDDFGARFADLARLHALGPDIVKIDRRLVSRAAVPAQDGERSWASTFAAVVDLAHRLGAFVIAEGVETQEQLAAALTAGCDAAQGYLLGRPEPLVERRRLAVAGV